MASSGYQVVRGRPSRLVGICFAAVVFSAMTTFLWQSIWHSGDGLTIANDSLDFGQVWAQRDFHWTLSISNPTRRDIRVSEVRSSCRCIGIDPKSFTVPPKQTVSLNVLLDLLPRTRKEAIHDIRTFSENFIALVSEPPNAPLQWTLCGSVRRHPLLVSESPIDFGKSLVRGLQFSPKTVEVRCSVRADNVEAACDPSLAAVRVTRTAEDPNMYKLEISPSPTLSVGDHEGEVRLTLAGSLAEESVPDLAVPLIVPVRHDVMAIPPVVSLGMANVGAVLRDIIVLGGNRRPFTVKPIEFEASGALAVEPAHLPGVNGKAFRVSQRVLHLGAHRSVARFVIGQDGDDESYEIAVPVYYDGQEM